MNAALKHIFWPGKIYWFEGLVTWCSTYPILLSMSCPDNFRWLQARRVPALQMIRSPRQPHLNCGSMSQILESVWILYTRDVSSASCWQESDRFSFAAVWAKMSNVCVDGWNTILSRIRFRDPDIGSIHSQNLTTLYYLVQLRLQPGGFGPRSVGYATVR